MKLFHLACILVYLMNIKQIIPQITTSNDSTLTTGLVEACCSTETSTKQNLSIDVNIDIPKIGFTNSNINPFRFLFSKGSSVLYLNHGLMYLMTFAVIYCK